ncbi:Murein L,D-transpeptidase YcbB/YkuD [Marinobacter daqiaonensis]|uniref:Murein L,D-transpeptidase YcbB/YkuD n=1 Tax=Marinobacter daqiaonensis TaxID=650891 RepID=A0A1I6JBB6_9GAMM|nr:L,D-transpeptidase family protein [Marinobacter daqiaonensis]SFR76287.1 Murein L,D-transpeptidase YcbB/YkuD [Marinobacter daqiaonensis]
MKQASSNRLFRGWTGSLRPAATLCLILLSAPMRAQSLEVPCPESVETPEFVLETLLHLESIKPHHDRWQEPLQWQRLLRQLDRLRIDGLSPQSYFLAELALVAQQIWSGAEPTQCHARLASLALAWSLSDLKFGRLDPDELGLMWHHQPVERDAELFAIDIHRNFYSRGGLREAYQIARPDAPAYLELRSAFREWRKALPLSWPSVAPGPTLGPGDSTPRVQALVERLAVQGYLPTPSHENPEANPSAANSSPYRRYDDSIRLAVESFQRDHGLGVDGVVGPRTLETLNRSPASWTAQVRANLERLRWVSPYLADRMVLVDINGADVSYFEGGREAWRSNTQVGRPERKTPALTSAISHVTVNPTWTIPPTVFYEDTLPAIQKDPEYLSRNNLTVLDRSGNPIPPEDVDWSRPGALMLRQAAGPGNALGQVAIRFPNPFSVYLHDTPSQRLFQMPNRFYSSGCVRVENAPELTEHLFAGAPTELRRQLEQLRGSGETRNIHLPQPVPLVMAYWTAEVSDAGRLRFRKDIYEHDRLVIDVLHEELP